MSDKWHVVCRCSDAVTAQERILALEMLRGFYPGNEIDIRAGTIVLINDSVSLAYEMGLMVQAFVAGYRYGRASSDR